MELFRRRIPSEHSRREDVPQPGPTELPGGGPPDDSSPSGDVQVIWGASIQNFQLGGMQVAQARPLLESVLRVDANSPVLVNGQPVRTNYRLNTGDVVEFVHHAGEKGRAPRGS